MKKYLITHTDLDGVSPIILLGLTNESFDYKCVDIKDLTNLMEELKTTDLSLYDEIYFTDLSLTEEMYDVLLSLNKPIKVFDHHETHLFANKYEFATVKVDLNNKKTCGTELFYEYLKEKYPELNKDNIKTYVEYVRELDTFAFTSDIPKQIDMIKESMDRYDFIKSMIRRLKKDKPFTFTTFEKRYIKLRTEELDRYIKKKEKGMQKVLINGFRCGVIFAETNKSFIGDYISQKYDDIDLVILIDASSRISYRTNKENINVADFASNFGGGGHKCASGSKFDNENRINILKDYFGDVKELEENC